LGEELNIIELDKEDIKLKNARERIKINFKTLKTICDDGDFELDEDMMVEYFNQMKYYQFSAIGNGITSILDGLSSFDGSRIYISDHILEKEGDDTVAIEHEICHNITRWVLETLKNTPYPRLISPEKYVSLRNVDNKMIEAGDYYEYKVYGKVPISSPFCLSNSQYHKIY